MSMFGYTRYQPYGCHKPYQLYPIVMVCYNKPYSIDKQVYAYAQQRLGLQSARFAQRGKHNGAFTLPRFHLQFTTQGATHTHRPRLSKKVLLTV